MCSVRPATHSSSKVQLLRCYFCVVGWYSALEKIQTLFGFHEDSVLFLWALVFSSDDRESLDDHRFDVRPLSELLP